MTRCPCLSPIADAQSHPEAHAAGRCVKCWEIDRYVAWVQEREAERGEEAVIDTKGQGT